MKNHRLALTEEWSALDWATHQQSREIVQALCESKAFQEKSGAKETKDILDRLRTPVNNFE